MEKPEIIYISTDLEEIYKTMMERFNELIDQFQNQGSGWQFDYVMRFDIGIAPYNPLSGSSYIPLPSFVANKKAVINVENLNDHECFKWAVTSAVFPKEEDPQRLTQTMRENSKNFDWTGIEFPVQIEKIDKFEKQNDYSICVITYDEENGFRPARPAKKIYLFHKNY